MADLLGQKLGGCELLEEIGQGGMGVIYRARQLSLDRIVAVKVLARRLAGDERFVERFQREARAIAKVNHANILAVYDVGEEDGIHFMIMELVDGGSAGELLENRGVLDPWDGAGIIHGAALGLDCAQRAGVIHRDVKPDNLMLTSDGVVKVSDFGLAKAIEAELTQTETVMGTPAYMSPEQCDGLKLDGRCDIYALGGTFFRLITGRLPFEAETPMTMMYRHKHEPLTPPHEIVPAIPEGLSRIICRMMEKNREDRYQGMAEVADAIEKARSSGAPIVDPLKTARLGPSVPVRRPGTGRMAAAPVQAKGEQLLAENKLVEGVRELRRALELDPENQELRERLRLLDTRIIQQRNELNAIRMLISNARLQEAVARWDRLPADQREETLRRQIEHIRNVALPAQRACNEAERAAGEGDLESAVALFQKALEIDPTNERGRQGLQSSQRRLGHATRLLQEGTERRMTQDFNGAAEALEGARRVHPQDTRILRALVEVHLAAGHHAAQSNQFDEAVTAWKRAIEVDPENREAAQLLEQYTARIDRMNALRRDAMELTNAKHHGAAARAWKRYLALAPHDLQAAARLASERRANSKQRVRRLIVLLVLLAGGGAGYEYWLERSTLDKAGRLLADSENAGRFDAARRLLREPPAGFLLFKARCDELLRKIEVDSRLAGAQEKEKAGRWKEAAEAYEGLALIAEPLEKPGMQRDAARCRCYDAALRGAGLEAQAPWRTNLPAAKAAYQEAHGHARPHAASLDREIKALTCSFRFIECFLKGDEHEKAWRPYAAGQQYRLAREQVDLFRELRLPAPLAKRFEPLVKQRERMVAGALKRLEGPEGP